MRLEHSTLTAALVAALCLAPPAVSAGEKHDHDHGHDHRQQDAHVHGIAALNVALEGTEVHIELDSPAANIVGFEYAPASDEDRAAVDRAVTGLKDGDGLFRFDAAAGCRLEDVKIASAMLDGGHDDHGHADEHKHKHEEEHGHAKEHGHDEEVHSDIEAAYHFECDRPGALTQLSVELFEAFPGTEKLNVQYVIGNKQGGAELTAAEHVVEF